MRVFKKRTWTVLVVAILALVCWAYNDANEQFFVPEGTSVLFITIDSLRGDHLSRSGHTRNTTPYLDRLANEGIYCKRCFAQSSWTLPSMLSLFSSLTPPVFGITEGVTPLPRPEEQGGAHKMDEQEVMLQYFSESYTTLPEVLSRAGYATAGFSTNGHLIIEQGFAQGFESFDQSSCMWGSAAGAFTAATKWLDDYMAVQRSRPFFLWVHLMDPHFDEYRNGDLPSPLYNPALGYEDYFAVKGILSLEEQTRIAYDRKVRYMDDRIAEFVEKLRTRGLLDKSVLVVASDHGEEFNEKGLWGHSKSLFNTLVQVPLIFRFPNEELRGELDITVRNLDVVPTLLDYLCVPADPAMAGQSLLPAFKDQSLSIPEVYGDTRRFDSDLRFFIDPKRSRKLIINLNDNTRKLFSSREDDGEIHDLAEIEPDVADDMERALRKSISEMESQAASTPTQETMTSEEIERLRSLGYIQ